MRNAPSKKLTLKKETLRTLVDVELPRLDGVVGGNTLAIGGEVIGGATLTAQPTVSPRTRTL